MPNRQLQLTLQATSVLLFLLLSSLLGLPRRTHYLLQPLARSFAKTAVLELLPQARFIHMRVSGCRRRAVLLTRSPCARWWWYVQ